MLKCPSCNKELIIKDKVLINNGNDLNIIYSCEDQKCDIVKIISSKDYI